MPSTFRGRRNSRKKKPGIFSPAANLSSTKLTNLKQRSKPKAAASAGSHAVVALPPPLDDAQAEPRLVAIGEHIVNHLPKGRLKLKTPRLPKLKAGVFIKTVKRGDLLKFSDHYRAALEKSDEHFSTFSMKFLIKGFMNKRNPNGNDDRALTQIVDFVSTARAPTAFTGGAIKGDIPVQHPSPLKTAMHADQSKTGRRHTFLDRSRREQVILAMEQAIKKNPSDVVEIVNAGYRRASTFTLNKFMVPVLASNNDQAFAVKQKISKQTRVKQMETRELMKDRAVKAGAETYGSGKNFSMSRPFCGQSQPMGSDAVSDARDS